MLVGNTQLAKGQRLVYHPGALPISAVFGLRYVHTLMRKWGASGTRGRHARKTSMRPVEK
jgi:hypothetical protein